jgi:dimethylglycine catabolism A
VQFVTRQGILRRLAQRRVEIVTLSEPCWNDSCADGRLEIVNIYNGDVRVIDDLAILTYATPRAPDDALKIPLHAAGIPIIPVGDARAPQEMLFATASGHAAGESV